MTAQNTSPPAEPHALRSPGDVGYNARIYLKQRLSGVTDDITRGTEELEDEEFEIGDGRPECPICQRCVSHAELLGAGGVSESVATLVEANTPGWQPEAGICRRCAERFAEAHERLRFRYPSFGHREYKILPTPLRLGASAALACGRRVGRRAFLPWPTRRARAHRDA